jgi:hypothetical protein
MERPKLIAGFTKGRLKLVLLRVALSCHLSAIRFSVEILSRTVVKGGVQVHPDLCLRISGIHRGWRWFGQIQSD